MCDRCFGLCGTLDILSIYYIKTRLVISLGWIIYILSSIYVYLRIDCVCLCMSRNCSVTDQLLQCTK